MSITFEVTKNLRPVEGDYRCNFVSVPIADGVERVAKSKPEASGANAPGVLALRSEWQDWRTEEQKVSVRVPDLNGLISAVHHAYDQHLPLELSPDDVWLAVAQGFAYHVNANAEQLRKRFVAHEGKKEIGIWRDGFVKGSPDNDWMGGFAEFSNKIGEHIGKKRDLLVSGFSTTGPIEKASSEVVLMDAMQAYFDYACYTCCGIPSVTLTGHVGDWEDVFQRTQVLAEFECQRWIETLLPVLDEFTKAAKGQPTVRFWESLYKRITHGSGAPQVHGAINAFFPYLKDDKKTFTRKNEVAWDGDLRKSRYPAPDNFPPGLSTVPFTWYYHTDTLPMNFYGGFVGSYLDPESKRIRPSIGWAVGDRPIAKEPT